MTGISPSLMADVEAAQLRRRAAKAIESLADYTKYIWPVIEPSTDLVWNWHLDLIGQALEAVSEGGAWVKYTLADDYLYPLIVEKGTEGAVWMDIRELVICVPPGTMKSILVSVMFQTFEWLRRPDLSGLYTSNDDDLVKRDSRRCRDIVESDEYKVLIELMAEKHGVPVWGLAKDQNEKHYFANGHKGFRQCVSYGSKVTGKRARRCIFDDIIDAQDVVVGTFEQIARRMDEAMARYDNIYYSRRNDLVNDPRIMIQQMLDDRDPANRLIKRP